MKRLITLICASLMTIILFAQIPFEVEMPEWTQIAVPNNPSGINIRKYPSTSAPRPMINEDRIEDFDIPAIYNAHWSTAPTKGATYPLMFTTSAPILKEENGWYELKGIGAQGENGWVSAKLCKSITPEPLTMEDIKNTEYLKDCVATGNNNGEDYIFVMSSSEMDLDVTFMLGKFVNGFIIFPYQLYAGYERGDKVNLVKNGEHYTFIVSSHDYDDEIYPCSIDLRGVSGEMLSLIMANMEKLPSPVIWYKLDGNITY